MFERPIISERADLDVVYADLATIVDLDVRLPASPFLRAGTDSICEFEEFRAGTFGPLLARLANQYNDEFVSGVSVDPNPEFYNEYYETLGAFRIPASEVASRYWNALSYEPYGDVTGALVTAVDVFCVVGSSGSWGIWGERPIGVAITRTGRSDLSWRRGSNLFTSSSDALQDFVEPNFNRAPLTQEFRDIFLGAFNSVGDING